ncbi:MAG: hypothetical protein ACYYK0_05600 [Candidatus Eutrophobiaceae bacterium]
MQQSVGDEADADRDHRLHATRGRSAIKHRDGSREQNSKVKDEADADARSSTHATMGRSRLLSVTAGGECSKSVIQADADEIIDPCDYGRSARASVTAEV